MSAMACSTPLVTSTVLAQGNFSTMSKSPSPSLTTASPIIGQVSWATVPTSPSRSWLPSASVRWLSGTWPRVSASLTGAT